MASRLSALRESALSAGEEVGERASRLMRGTQASNVLTFALVAVSGFALGMLTGILIAPSSGYETRHRISDRTSEAMESAKRMARRRAEEMSKEAEKIA